jgi:hypothetical protein
MAVRGVAVFKLFTISEATRLLPVIEGHVAALQGASHDAEALKQRLAEIASAAGAGRTTDRVESQNLLQELSFLAACAHDAKAELDRLGVELTDLEGGAVAIPASVGGEVVALTWARGQDAITHYRRLRGDADPRPLPSEVRVPRA